MSMGKYEYYRGCVEINHLRHGTFYNWKVKCLSLAQVFDYFVLGCWCHFGDCRISEGAKHIHDVQIDIHVAKIPRYTK